MVSNERSFLFAHWQSAGTLTDNQRLVDPLAYKNYLELMEFEAAARCGSLSVASEELRLTASAISHQVKALKALACC